VGDDAVGLAVRRVHAGGVDLDRDRRPVGVQVALEDAVRPTISARAGLTRSSRPSKSLRAIPIGAPLNALRNSSSLSASALSPSTPAVTSESTERISRTSPEAS